MGFLAACSRGEGGRESRIQVGIGEAIPCPRATPRGGGVYDSLTNVQL